MNEKSIRRRRRGNILIIIGLLFFVGAGCLLAYNLYEDAQAKKAAESASAQLEKRLISILDEKTPDEEEERLAEYILNPDIPMPTENIDGQDYIGTIDIPSVEMSLPVISEWSYPRLKLSPCRYSGSVYKNDMILLAHNYKSHFGKLHSAAIGAEVSFTDTEGHVFNYEIVAMQTIEPTDFDGLNGGDWDLSMFTCTRGGKARLVVRCNRV